MAITPNVNQDSSPAAPEIGRRPRLRRVQAVVNEASGSVGPGAAVALSELIEAHGYDLVVSSPSGAELEGAVRAAVDAAPDLVVILGGDGTARIAAKYCGWDGPLLAALPGGTLNMLPHVLYGQLAWRAALEAALAEGVERPVCGGWVGDHEFYVASILGSPALWGGAREAIRAGKLRRAWRRATYALRRSFTGRIRYDLDGLADGDAEALVLISPTVSRNVQEEAALEVAQLNMHNAREMFRLAFHGLAGDWRRDPGITVHQTVHGRVEAHKAIPCILDGEILSLPHHTEFGFKPRAFRALALPGVSGAIL